jgi:hypothetical protein
MIVGFTGSRHGMSAEQFDSFVSLIATLDITEFHHGDCIGADAEAHGAVVRRFPKAKIVLHPPRDPILRAFKKGTILPAKDYLERNKDIVDACELLIAVPLEISEATRSGTWSTVRYAKRMAKPIHLLYPSA